MLLLLGAALAASPDSNATVVKLDNGLTVILAPQHGTNLVTTKRL